MENINKSFSVNNYGDLDLWTYFPTPQAALEAGMALEALREQAWATYEAELEKSKEVVEKSEVTFIKSLDTEKQHFTAVVLRPEVVDAHGDIYSHEAVEMANESFMLKSQNANVQHLFNTDAMSVVESYIAKSDALDGGILEGDWVMTMKVHDDSLWEMCKNGEFTGFSVGCQGSVVEIEE